MIRKSKYTFLFIRNGEYLIYNAARNSFWAVNEYVYNLIDTLSIEDECLVDDEEKKSQIAKLHSLGILSTEMEDETIVNQIRIRNLIGFYATDTLGITLLPTISCNLACPYCFEQGKPQGMMTTQTCDKVIDFIKNHSNAKYLALTWYGGEPLLGIKVIEYFLHKLKEITNVSLAAHAIVTNGTFLDSKHWDIFKEYPLTNIQITLDGKKETHDKRRIRHDGTGTYDIILDNMRKFADEFPNVQLSVRVNIDKENFNEFMPIYNYIKSIFPDKKNLYVYPGILTGSDNIPDTPFLAKKELAVILNNYMKEGYPKEYPDIGCRGCGATRISSYVIGPKGEIYKCWEDVGKDEEVVGNVYDKKYTNSPVLCNYLLKGSIMYDPKCWECELFPICKEDCARRRLDNMLKGKNFDLCSIYKHNEEAFYDMLYMFYKSKKKA